MTPIICQTQKLLFNMIRKRHASWSPAYRRALDLYLVARGTSFVRVLVANLRILMSSWVIFVSLCLFLCTKNFGQYCKWVSSCCSASEYCLFNLENTRTFYKSLYSLAQQEEMLLNKAFLKIPNGNWPFEDVVCTCPPTQYSFCLAVKSDLQNQYESSAWRLLVARGKCIPYFLP